MKAVYFQKEKVNIRELIGLSALAILFAIKGMGFYDGQIEFKVAMIVSILLLAIEALGEFYTKYELFGWILWGAVAGVNYCIARDKGVLVCLVLLFTIKMCSLELVSKVGACTLIGTGIVNIILARIGLREGTVVLHNKLGGEIFRYAFGQPHPNVLHTTYVVIYCFVLYAYRNKRSCMRINWLLLFGNFLVFIYTVSYTGFLMGILLFGVTIVAKLHEESRWIDWLITYAVLIGTIMFAVFLPIYANLETSFFQGFMQSISHRFILLNRYYEEFGITFWGQTIAGTLWYQLDTSWAVLLLNGGILLFISFVLLYILGFHCLLKQNRLLEVYMICVLLLGGLMDPFLFNSSVKNVGLFFLGDAIYCEYFRNNMKDICLSKRISVLLGKEISLKLLKVKKNEISIMKSIVVIGIGIIGAICIMQFIKLPTKYIVTSMDDLGERNYVAETIEYSELIELQNNQDIKILGDYSEDSSFWIVDSARIRWIEYYRTLLGIAIEIVVVVGLMEFLYEQFIKR